MGLFSEVAIAINDAAKFVGIRLSDRIFEVSGKLDTAITSLDDITHAINGLAKALVRSQTKPGLVFLQFLKEGSNGMKVFTLKLPLATAEDVKYFEVVYKVGDAEPVTLMPVNPDYGKTPATPGEIPNLQAENGTVVSGTICCVDDAGNKGPAREFSLEVLDTSAPPMPGEVGIVITDEFADAPVDPPVDPVPPTDPV
jgi:hypothetical protein